MDINLQKYIDVATAEILDPQFEITKQYLEVNEIEFEDEKPKVERVDTTDPDGFVSVYFRIKDEEYFFQVILNTVPEVHVHFADMENGNEVYFTATSEELTLEELSAYLKLSPLSGFSKGDQRKPGRPYCYKFSRVFYAPFKSNACDMQTQIELLLNELEKDGDGIRRLSEKAHVSIDVCRHQYVSANAGIHFDVTLTERMVKLNLSIDIGTYIVGEEIKD